MHFVLFVLIGLVAGAVAGRVASGRGHGLLGDITIGMVGGFLGGWIFTMFGSVADGEIVFSLVTALVGAIALFGAIRLIAPARF